MAVAGLALHATQSCITCSTSVMYCCVATVLHQASGIRPLRKCVRMQIEHSQLFLTQTHQYTLLLRRLQRLQLMYMNSCQPILWYNTTPALMSPHEPCYCCCNHSCPLPPLFTRMCQQHDRIYCCSQHRSTGTSVCHSHWHCSNYCCEVCDAV